MSPHPLTLAHTVRKALSRTPSGPVDRFADPYQPLLAGWLLQLSLLLGWYRTGPQGELLNVLDDNDFESLTGLHFPEAGESSGPARGSGYRPGRGRESGVEAGRILIIKECLDQWRQQAWEPESLPLFANIALLGELVGAGTADQAVLLFTAVLSVFPRFKAAVSPRCEQVGDSELTRIIAELTAQDPAAIRAALRPSAPLASTGIVRMTPGTCDLEEKLHLLDALVGLLLLPNISAEDLGGHFLKRVAPPQVDLAAFPHLHRDIAALKAYLAPAARTGVAGANVLFYGPPGTGKTELAKALAADLGLDIFEIAFADENGHPIRGEMRLQAYNLGQRLLALRDNALLLFDEIEDVFAKASPLWLSLEGRDSRSESVGGKAWINRTLELNPVPALWITNDPRLDTAYLRRFGYSVQFPIPPQKVRMAIIRHYFEAFEPDHDWLARIAGHERLTPGQLERAATFARIAAGREPRRALDLAAQNLERSACLLGQTGLPPRPPCPTVYDPRFLNIDLDLQRLLAGLRRRPTGSFCFYGPPGTGKSELGRHIADVLERPLILRRASDILSKWVGETEQNLAAMFAEARQREAVLVLDEADSFLAQRSAARHAWEVTQVNELLTQMEAHDGVFIATTNLMERLDQASLRRFLGKIGFDYLTRPQRRDLFRQELVRLGGRPTVPQAIGRELDRLDTLTPGDFAVAARCFALWNEPATATELLTILQRECAAKPGNRRPIGFVA